MNMTAECLLQEAQEMRETIISDRRYLHTHPGTGFAIKDTVEYVKKELESLGYEPKECGKAGLIALAGLLLAQLFSGTLDAQSAVLSLFNGAMVSLAANGGYAALKRVMGGTSDSDKPPEE